jgi:hypothetical protein
VNITDNSATTVKDNSDKDFIIKAPGNTGSLRINTSPGGANISLDGWQRASPANTTLSSIDPGSHIVTVNLSGYLDQSQGIVLPSGQQNFNVSFILEPIGTNSISGLPNSPDDTGRMVITSTPGDSEVWIKALSNAGSVAVFKGKTTYGQEFVPGTNWQDFPKKFMVTVKHSGYKDLTLPVSVARGLTTYADFELEVNPYQFTGFDDPVDMGTEATPIVNIGTAGRNIPLKWHLSDANGGYVSDSTKFNVIIDGPQKSCDAAASDELEAYDPATTTPGLSYQGNGLWHYNWKTLKTTSFIGKCYNVYLVFDNEVTTPIARFKFK